MIKFFSYAVFRGRQRLLQFCKNKKFDHQVIKSVRISNVPRYSKKNLTDYRLKIIFSRYKTRQASFI
ncbi:MAG: hypothetical protein DRI57_28030 [Deltaproteobacteria bacterium]|nr:MAG: hypothetical protein DRI57_28030 [Deltaproteobacteria bacterium]